MSDVREMQVTFDAGDPIALARFWSEVLGYVIAPVPGQEIDPNAGPDQVLASWKVFLESAGVPPEQYGSACAIVDPASGSPGSGPRLFFQRVPEGKTAKNRVHLDVRAAPGLAGNERMAALHAEADRLTALGAAVTARHEPAPPMSGGFIVMTDPEGNEFCLD